MKNTKKSEGRCSFFLFIERGKYQELLCLYEKSQPVPIGVLS